jgi:S1-C subfamily serine protease
MGTVHTGTGFIVNPGGCFITCAHVVDDAVDFAICIDGTRLLRKSEVIAMDTMADLALCWMADRNGSPDWLLLAGKDATPALGDDLGLLGFPLGVDLGLSVTYSQGIVNSLRQRGDRGQVSVLQIDVGAAPGSSGGPVFRRKDGKVLGVLTSGLDVQERGMMINFAVDLRMLWRLGWVA